MVFQCVADVEDVIASGYIRIKLDLVFQDHAEAKRMWDSHSELKAIQDEPFDDLCAMAYFRYYVNDGVIAAEKPMVDLCSCDCNFLPFSVEDSYFKPSARENLVKHIKEYLHEPGNEVTKLLEKTAV